MCRGILEDEANWRGIQIFLAVAGIFVAGLLAFQQNQINQQLLDLNFRTVVGFQYDEKSGVATLYNYGETPISVEAARVISLPEAKNSVAIQNIIFPKQSIELNFKEHLGLSLSTFGDGHYGGMYQLFLQTDTATGKQTHIGQIAFSLEIKASKVDYVIPSSTLSLYKYDGTALDFINRSAN